jgi:hypothetical protein
MDKVKKKGQHHHKREEKRSENAVTRYLHYI